MKQLQFRFIETGTPAYQEMINLRMKVLLDPIGIPSSYINAEKEAKDLLIGGYDEDTLVGCCILTCLTEDIVQLRQMAVDTAQQQNGIGTLLLSFAEATAVQKGYTTLMMHARDPVLPFYQKCGYSISGEPFVEVGISHHKMLKQLSPVNKSW